MTTSYLLCDLILKKKLLQVLSVDLFDIYFWLKKSSEASRNKTKFKTRDFSEKTQIWSLYDVLLSARCHEFSLKISDLSEGKKKFLWTFRSLGISLKRQLVYNELKCVKISAKHHKQYYWKLRERALYPDSTYIWIRTVIRRLSYMSYILRECYKKHPSWL